MQKGQPMQKTLQNLIITPLANLANARELEATHPSRCNPIIPGKTHCNSCGFHYSTPTHIASHRNTCKTPTFHTQTH